MAEVSAAGKRIVANIEKVVVGKRQGGVAGPGRLLRRGTHPP